MFASRNAGKRSEIARLLTGVIPDVRMLDGAAPDVAETGETFFDNALLKARSAFSVYRMPSLADDSGLTVDALNGDPGVRSARYAGPNASDEDRVRTLLDAMRGFGHARRYAQFRCTLVLMLSDSLYASFEGIVHGRIMDSPRGKNGFGYDPIFVPNGYTRTFAEIEADEKNYLSHRGMAVLKCRRFLTRLQG